MNLLSWTHILFFLSLSLPVPTFTLAAQTEVVNQTVQCRCGQVKLKIASPDAMRFVCYCQDCRGYYNTLNDHACKCQSSLAEQKDCAAAQLDRWGGVDYTQIYPSEITALSGKDKIKVAVIREGSHVNRFYTTCCHTPLFSVGPSGSALLSTNLIREKERTGVRFRIIGRSALKTKENRKGRPRMSWSVPMAWFWTMPRRIRKDLATPLPIDMPDHVPVLDGFQKG